MLARAQLVYYDGRRDIKQVINFHIAQGIKIKVFKINPLIIIIFSCLVLVHWERKEIRANLMCSEQKRNKLN